MRWDLKTGVMHQNLVLVLVENTVIMDDLLIIK